MRIAQGLLRLRVGLADEILHLLAYGGLTRLSASGKALVVPRLTRLLTILFDLFFRLAEKLLPLLFNFTAAHGDLHVQLFAADINRVFTLLDAREQKLDGLLADTVLHAVCGRRNGGGGDVDEMRVLLPDGGLDNSRQSSRLPCRAKSQSRPCPRARG